MEDICLQCLEKCLGPSKRLVQDSCGHKKCRSCLLADVEKCKQCLHEAITQKRITDIDTPLKCDPVVLKCDDDVPPKKTELPTSETKLPSKKRPKQSSRPYKALNVPPHISITRDPLSYNCKICDKSFTTKAHVKYHIYCAQVKPHKCEQCNREFVLKTQFDVHMRKHIDSKIYTCGVCEKSFDERYKLNRHLKSHTNERPYMCEDCGRSYRSRNSLSLHAFIHNGTKPFACNQCPARFNHVSNLTKHSATHTREKNHMCDICGKTFTLKNNLSQHRKSHLPSRQFACGLCPKTFMTNKELQRHSQVHNESQAFTCVICNTNFGRKDNLRRHIKNSHPNTVPTGEEIKSIANKPSLLHRVRPVDNPNAVNVIKSPPSYTRRKAEPPVSNKSDTRSSTVISGPIKLAFKTPAFKNNYNIQRDLSYVPPASSKKSYDFNDSVNIYQKILLPQSPPPSRNVDIEPLSQKSLAACGPLHYETSFQNRKHAMIKNIKFKRPIQNSRMEDVNKAFGAESGEGLGNGTNNNTYTELKTVNSGTSVIVNASQPNNIHWRRRISQNLNLDC